MDVQRQFVRHRMASLNEYSTRYSEALDGAMATDPDEWRLQATDNKQGSSRMLVLYPDCANVGVGFEVDDATGPQKAWRSTCSPGEYLSARERNLQVLAREVYEERIAFGVAREQARKDLPLSTWTDCVYQFNYRSLRNFLTLRTDAHAQQEIRAYAQVLERFCADWLPFCHEAWLDFDRHAHMFSRSEMGVLRELLLSAASRIGLEGMLVDANLTKREIREFFDAIDTRPA